MFTSPIIQDIFSYFFIASFKNICLPVQEMQRETPSYEALLQGLVNLGLCLYPTAPETRVQELSDDLTQLQERCASLKNSISHRQYSCFTFHRDCLNFVISP